TAGLHYSYEWDMHEIGLEAFWYDRNIQTLQDTENARVGLYWTVNFYKPQGQSSFGGSTYTVAENAASTVAEIPLIEDITLVENLGLRQPLERQLSASAFKELGSPAQLGRATVYDVVLLNDVSQR